MQVTWQYGDSDMAIWDGHIWQYGDGDMVIRYYGDGDLWCVMGQYSDTVIW